MQDIIQQDLITEVDMVIPTLTVPVVGTTHRQPGIIRDLGLQEINSSNFKRQEKEENIKPTRIQFNNKQFLCLPVNTTNIIHRQQRPRVSQRHNMVMKSFSNNSLHIN